MSDNLICQQCGNKTTNLVCRGRRYTLNGDLIVTNEVTEREMICNECSEELYIPKK